MQQLAEVIDSAVQTASDSVPSKPGVPVQDRGADICVEMAMAKRQSWTNPESARVRALRDAVSKFLLSHRTGELQFRISEPGHFVVEDMHGKECTEGEIHQRIRAF